MNPILRLFFIAMLLFLPQCGWTSDLSLSSLAQKGQHHALIAELQPGLTDGSAISSFRLLLLGSAYYSVRQYRDAGLVADILEKRIAAGDATYFTGDLSIYPEYLRAVISLDQGAYDDAIRHASAVHNRLKTGQSFYTNQLIDACDILGVANALLGRTDEANRYLEIIRKVDIGFGILGPAKYGAMARIYMALKQFDKALESINDRSAGVSGALTLFYDQTFQNLPKYFIRYKSLFETGRTKGAREGYDQLLRHPQIEQYGGLYWLILHDRARIAQSEGEIATAMDLLKRAVDIIERQRSSIDNEAGRIGFVGDKQAVYRSLISLLLAQGLDQLAFEYVERSKARALVDLLASQHGVAPRARTPAEAHTLQLLESAELATTVLPPADQPTRTAQGRNLVVERREQLQSEAPELASLVAVQKASSAVVQSLLLPDEALLEYFYTDRQLFAFLVTASGIRAFPLQRDGLEESVQRLRKAIASPDSNAWLGEARSLHERLLAPVSGLAPFHKLVVVPHGVLHYLPFNALHSGDAFVIDRFSIRVAPSAAVLEFLKSRGYRPVTTALLVGNPDLHNPALDLKYAQDEVLAIAGLLPGANVLLRRDATASIVRERGREYSLLHFATHGGFNAGSPLDSALYFAPEDGTDGRLTVSDLYALELDAALVTLSACDTALGRIANGDDVIGFTRGLLYAGASSIVSSLWQVDDLATRDLMVSFYSDLPVVGKQDALRQAQLKAKSSREHPFYWAAFMLTGNAK